VNIETEHLRDGTGHQPSVGELRQIDEPDPMLIGVNQSLGHNDGDEVLPMPPGPTMLTNWCHCSRHDAAYGIGASDQSGLLRGQIMTLSRRCGPQWCGCRRLCDTDRGDKAITLARRRRDVPPAGASVAQRPVRRRPGI
jgi:hypothetical protein